MAWKYRDKAVAILPNAEISSNFYRRDADLVQRMLHDVPPWEQDEFPVEGWEIPDGRKVALLVVPLEAGDRIIWGFHAALKHRNPVLAPFVRRRKQPFSDEMTLELAGSAEAPSIARIYAGPARPMLPGAPLTRASTGEVLFDPDDAPEARRTFWRQHAFLYREGVVRKVVRTPGPSWFLEG